LLFSLPATALREQCEIEGGFTGKALGQY